MPLLPNKQLVERAIRTLCTKYNSPTIPTNGSVGASAAPSSAAPPPPAASCDKMVGVVRLSGLLHLEERAAFQEIARQLCG